MLAIKLGNQYTICAENYIVKDINTMKCLNCFYALANDDNDQELLFCEVSKKNVCESDSACARFLSLEADICFNCFHADIDSAEPQILCRKNKQELAADTNACVEFISGIIDICASCYHVTPQEEADYTQAFCSLQKLDTKSTDTCPSFVSLSAAACFNCQYSKLPADLTPNTLFCTAFNKAVSPIQQNCAEFSEL